MASAHLKRHQAVIWLPPRSAGERAFGAEARLLAHVGVDPSPVARPASLDGREGVRQVSLIADARDVSLIEVMTPPLSGSRLRMALPNLVEEFLLQDPARCLIVPGPVTADGKRMVAVIDREWVEFVIGAFARRNIRVDRLWAAQMVLPVQPGEWSLGCLHDGLALRLDERRGSGWTASADAEGRVEAIVAHFESAGFRAAPPSRLCAWVEDPSWQDPVQQAAQRVGVPVEVARLPLVRQAPMDLLAGRDGGLKAAWAQFDWRVWRTPALLAAACVAIFLIGLNVHWGMQQAEKTALRSALVQKFRAAFPQTTTVVDPVLQMRRNVTALRAESGRAGPEDFVPMVSRLAQALGGRGQDGITALEFRNGEIKVRFNETLVAGAAARESLRQACARLGLRLMFDNDRDPTARVVIQGA